ncbi:uncharacterized protein tbc1d12a isoform X2 [Neoarius graeffei]|uniref:uncharacterized protein tbc1d12a isoform X2 n=1 Tax=Neoarius graeffei TaxID=443677 RepID=UPI00298C4D9E|nr:uncharacterized protein tbc1d12a isoform X2 [Neoarius graeffei]
MEMDREDGTELVLSFALDVGDNRAAGSKAAPQSSHRNRGFQAPPTSAQHSAGVRVTSGGTELNGFPEPDGGVELSLQPEDGESKPGTSGHIRTPGGETGPNLSQHRALGCSGVHLTASGLRNSANGEEGVDLFGFHAGGGTNLITSGETSDTRRNHSRRFVSGEAACAHGHDGPLTASGHTNTLDADVWEFRVNTFVIGESSGNQTTSAEISGDRGANTSWDITASETDGGLTASRPGTTSDGERANIWEFHGHPAVIGEIISTGKTSGNQTTSGEITGWAHVSPVALVETSGPRESSAVSQETVSIRGTVCGTSLPAFGETDVSRCTQVSSAVAEETSQTGETDASPSVTHEMVDVGGTSASLSTSGETACTRKTSPGPVVAGISGSLTTCGNVNTSDVKTAATFSGDPTSLRESAVSQVEAGPTDTLLLVDGASPRDQVSGNLHLGNDAMKAKFAIRENPDCPRVCVGTCPSSWHTELEMKIPNGDVNCDKLQMDRIQCEGTFTSKALDKGVRVGNCGYLVINQRTISRTSSIPVYSIREPWSTTERQQELRSTSDLGPKTISDFSKLSLANVNEDVSNQEIEPRPDYSVDFSDGVGVARPRTLRTNLGPGKVVSWSCDSTPLNDDDAGYFVDDGDMDVIMNSVELGRRRSAPDKLQKSKRVDPEPSAEQTVNRRPGFTDFLTRSLFSWKESKATAAASGWRLFGKMSPRGNGKDSGIPQQTETVRHRKLEFEPLSTTGLILEDRPANLPAKCEEEAQRHRQQYSEMMAGAKRRELKEAQRKKKQMKERHRQEESIARAVVIWNTEILPNWGNVRNTRRVRELWWQGLPPSIRGKIWSLAIGNELNITPELYEIFLSRAKEKWRSFTETGSLSEGEDCGVDKESSLDLIKLDIFRTFPSLYIFQKGGPYHDVLHNALGAYTCYRPDVGYVQGMSFIAAVLILNLEEADAFIAFANLLNKPCQMAFFRVDHDLVYKIKHLGVQTVFTVWSWPLPLPA